MYVRDKKKNNNKKKYSSDERNKLRSNITYKGNESQDIYIYTHTVGEIWS